LGAEDCWVVIFERLVKSGENPTRKSVAIIETLWSDYRED
jgi:hypothetical protein